LISLKAPWGDEAAALASTGFHSVPDLARCFAVTRGRVNEALLERGVDLNGARRRNRSLLSSARTGVLSGPRLVALYGCSEQHLVEVLLRAGLTLVGLQEEAVRRMMLAGLSAELIGRASPLPAAHVFALVEGAP
jgi:hypothetical protein